MRASCVAREPDRVRDNRTRAAADRGRTGGRLPLRRRGPRDGGVRSASERGGRVVSAPEPAAQGPILELRSVSKVYRARTSLMRYALVPAVQDVTLAIEPRTTTCIMGETGSGKSTI